MRKIVGWLILLLCCSFLVNAQKGYHNKFWGFSMKKPEGWIMQDTGFAFRNLEKFKLTQKLQDRIQSEAAKTTMVVVWAKRDPKTTVGAFPMIKVNATATGYTSPYEFLKKVQSDFAAAFKVLDNGRFEQEPQLVTINGSKAVAAVISFDAILDDTRLRNRAFVYAFLRKGHFIQFSFSDIMDREACSQLYRELASTIIFDKK